MDRCTHYRFPGGGVLTPDCALGVMIREHVGGDDFGWFRRMPCVLVTCGPLASTEVVSCESFESEGEHEE